MSSVRRRSVERKGIQYSTVRRYDLRKFGGRDVGFLYHSLYLSMFKNFHNKKILKNNRRANNRGWAHLVLPLKSLEIQSSKHGRRLDMGGKWQKVMFTNG